MKTQHGHPATTRIAHWLNAAVIGILLWSGFSIFSGDKHFAPIVHLLPAWLWSALALTGHRKLAFGWHTWVGVAFAANGLFYLVASTRGRAWRTWSQYHLPQRAVYTGVIAMGGVMVLTGFALWFKHRLPWLLAGMGGERIVLPVHVVLATAVLAFLAIHVIQVVRAGWPTLRAMLSARTRDRTPAHARPNAA